MSATISLVGDSQAQGLLNAGLPDTIAARWLSTLYRVGANSEGVHALITQALSADGAPAVFVVVAGGGDVNLSESRAVSAWQAIIADLTRAGVRKVVWLGPPAAQNDPALDALRLRVSQAQQALFQGTDVLWIDGRSLAEGLPRRDRVHMTATGYRTYAARLKARLDSVLQPTVASTAAAAASSRTGVRLILIAGIALGGLLMYRASSA